MLYETLISYLFFYSKRMKYCFQDRFKKRPKQNNMFLHNLDLVLCLIENNVRTKLRTKKN